MKYNIINYICNGLFIFFFLAVYYNSKVIINSGFLNFTPVKILVLALLFYVPSVVLYFRRGGNPFFFSRITCVLMIIPSLILYLSFSQYHKHFGQNPFENLSPFLIISMLPLLFTILLNVLNGIFTLVYKRRKKTT
ncbi:hypothetical protein BKP35_17545 [Anaerobacillus arseniciselenatis]|uniref:Uncharacterized protein n=1 Tax=Anaerobacillus arseniciselenatis TaxID=85682 RepID=A0A1S2L9N0_9BACI|nr:hypothetical protein [Anaerobacillus arseniciselenatis]OIJ08713.1 hypothetical protein BKP35_17545 [Anaerobacillus arseniciselenatis]